MIYIEYLVDLIDDHIHNVEDYSKLIDELDSIPYHWRFILDDNRAKAGMNLRTRFSSLSGVDVDDIRSGPASVFEVLIAVANNMADQTECEQCDMFWLMLRNLGLDKLTNQLFDEKLVHRVIDIWLDGLFDADGNGSPFPLRDYNGDATHLDLWSLMNEYIYEEFHEAWTLQD